jgi:hypothetical protein
MLDVCSSHQMRGGWSKQSGVAAGRHDVDARAGLAVGTAGALAAVFAVVVVVSVNGQLALANTPGTALARGAVTVARGGHASEASRTEIATIVAPASTPITVPAPAPAPVWREPVAAPHASTRVPAPSAPNASPTPKGTTTASPSAMPSAVRPSATAGVTAAPKSAAVSEPRRRHRPPQAHRLPASRAGISSRDSSPRVTGPKKERSSRVSDHDE